MNNNEKQSFLDPKTIIAIVLVGAAWMGWQWYMQQKYPEAFKPKQAQKVEQQARTQEGTPNSTGSLSGGVDASEADPGLNGQDLQAKNDEISDTQPRREELVHYEDQVWSFEFSSKGMGIKNLKLKNFTDRDGKLVSIGRDQGFLPFETNLTGKRTPIDFEIERKGDNRFVGRAEVGPLTIVKTVIVNSERYSLDTHVQVQGQSDSFSGLTTYIAEDVEKAEGGSFLLPQFDKQEFFVAYAGTDDRVVIGEDEETEAFSKVKLASLSSHYFAQALIDESDIMPELKAMVDESTSSAIGVLTYPVLNRANVYSVKYTGFMGPKSLGLLKSVDEELAGVIDFGMFSFIARYILELMKWFYSLVGNWGVAIILLTIVVRILVLPFTVMSFRSMKEMQKIQPQIKAIKEKHKDDQQRQSQEMMMLMKNHKVNPLGGCLPMFLQFPVFIALYQVLGQSIELYQAPFGFWIQDLSLRDPFYVLPVLMGVTMFFQQKLSPSTLDPAQAKVLMFMPVIFAFFMLGLPSGLTLYIFVSALFGIVQQFYFMKERRSAQATAS